LRLHCSSRSRRFSARCNSGSADGLRNKSRCLLCVEWSEASRGGGPVEQLAECPLCGQYPCVRFICNTRASCEVTLELLNCLRCECSFMQYHSSQDTKEHHSSYGNTDQTFDRQEGHQARKLVLPGHRVWRPSGFPGCPSFFDCCLCPRSKVAKARGYTGCKSSRRLPIYCRWDSCVVLTSRKTDLLDLFIRMSYFDHKRVIGTKTKRMKGPQV
jgi:hypothetical protein